MLGDSERTVVGLEDIVVPRPKMKVGKTVAFGVVLLVIVGAIVMIVIGSLSQQIVAAVVMYLTVAIVGGFFEKDLMEMSK